MKAKDCISKEAINNRFLATSDKITGLYLKSLFGNIEKEALARLRRLHPRASDREIKKLRRQERKALEKEWNSPLAKAERRIRELETHLEQIKAVVNDPHYIDNLCP